MKFKIIIPMYNVEDWVETTITSLKEQTHENYDCVILDDLSTDSSVKIVSSLIENDSRFKLIVNKDKKFALKNIIDGIKILNPEKEDVIVTLDGDDWLSNKNVLSRVAEEYTSKDVWLTYGNHTNFPDGEPYWPLFRYPDSVVQTNSFRKFRFLASHLRTFKFKLWQNVKEQDLQDEDGNYFQTAWDLAMMFPMLEMCGNRFSFIEDVLYVYNNKNPLNDYKIYQQLQIKTDMMLRMKPSYYAREKL